MNENNEKNNFMEIRRKNLTNVYDVINKIARAHKERGESVSDWFYTKEQIEELKKILKTNLFKNIFC